MMTQKKTLSKNQFLNRALLTLRSSAALRKSFAQTIAAPQTARLICNLEKSTLTHEAETYLLPCSYNSVAQVQFLPRDHFEKKQRDSQRNQKNTKKIKDVIYQNLETFIECLKEAQETESPHFKQLAAFVISQTPNFAPKKFPNLQADAEKQMPQDISKIESNSH